MGHVSVDEMLLDLSFPLNEYAENHKKEKCEWKWEKIKREWKQEWSDWECDSIWKRERGMGGYSKECHKRDWKVNEKQALVCSIGFWLQREQAGKVASPFD